MKNFIGQIVDKGALIVLSLLIFSFLLGAGQFLYKIGLPLPLVSLIELAAVYGGLYAVQLYGVFAPKRTG